MFLAYAVHCSAQVKCSNLFHSAVVQRAQVLILLSCSDVTHSDLVFCLVIECFIAAWWLWKPLTGMGPVPVSLLSVDVQALDKLYSATAPHSIYIAHNRFLFLPCR